MESAVSERRSSATLNEDSVNHEDVVTTETTGLLSQDRRDSDYGSDGETNNAMSDVPETDEVTTSERRRRRSEENNNQDPLESRGSRGLKFIYKKILNALPSFGDDDEEPNSEANEAALRFGAQQMILLVFPVFICMALVVLIQLSVESNVASSGQTLIYSVPESVGGGNSGLIFLIALANVAIIIVLVVIMTIVLVCLYKYRCYLVIKIWLMVASAVLLFIFSSFFFVEVLQVHHLTLDWISFVILIWNFGGMGVLSIHWKGPLRLQQAYLIFCSALTANIFIKYLPNWTAWLLLFAISIYDLIAVLSPKGPLRVLVETAKERNESIFPSLIYSTTMIWIIGMADRDSSKNQKKDNNDKESDNEGETTTSTTVDESSTEVDGAAGLTQMQSSLAPDEQRQNVRRRSANEREMEEQQEEQQEQQQEEEEEPRGFKLGLGDFIFYSILVGKAASDSNGDWVVISSCFVAILIGLCMTTLILGIVRRALPALPISIFFGLIFYFTSQYLFAPFAIILSTTQTFI